MNPLKFLLSTGKDVVKKSGYVAENKDLGLSGKLPVPIVQGVTELVNGVTDYLKVAEIEETKRTEITSRRDVALSAIAAQRENISELLKYTFQERAAVIQKQFEVLDIAISRGDLALASQSLNAMVSVIQTSPFKNVQEMQAMLSNKDSVVRFE